MVPSPPVAAWVVLFRRAISVALKALLLSIVILPLAKLILATRLDLTCFSFPKFLLAFVLFNFFCGMGSIFYSRTKIMIIDPEHFEILRKSNNEKEIFAQK